MQAQAWLPANAQDIDLAVRLRSNGDAGAAAFGAGPLVKSVSDVAATATVTDHAWPQNLDSVDACEPITMESTSPQRTLRSAPPENRRGASDGTVTTLRPPLGDALTNAAADVCFRGKADIGRLHNDLSSSHVLM